MKIKKRLDQLVFERGLARSRERAKSLIMLGQVLVNDEPGSKPGQFVDEGVQLRVRGQDFEYVSRGALKLIAAMDQFKIVAQGRVGLDVGASTGGFTQVLLKRGIRQVYAIDVGHNQLDWSIRSDSRVIVREKVNARNLLFDEIGTTVDVIVIDVSFISLEKILPSLLQFATFETDWVTLIKPQFEVGREKVQKGGLVHSEEDRMEAVTRVIHFCKNLGLQHLGLIDSPIAGASGNKEYLAYWKRAPQGE